MVLLLPDPTSLKKPGKYRTSDYSNQGFYKPLKMPFFNNKIAAGSRLLVWESNRTSLQSESIMAASVKTSFFCSFS